MFIIGHFHNTTFCKQYYLDVWHFSELSTHYFIFRWWLVLIRNKIVGSDRDSCTLLTTELFGVVTMITVEYISIWWGWSLMSTLAISTLWTTHKECVDLLRGEIIVSVESLCDKARSLQWKQCWNPYVMKPDESNESSVG